MTEEHKQRLGAFDGEVIDFVSANYANFSAIMIFGSSSDGHVGPLSDIDLFILFREPIHPFREKKLFNGRLFDIIVYDFETLNGLVHLARRGDDTVILEIVTSARVLPVELPETQYLKRAALAVRRLPPIMQDVMDWRQYLTGVCDDIRASGCSAEMSLLSVELFRTIIKLVLQILGSGGYRKRQAIAVLRNYDPAYLEKLNLALTTALGGAPEKLIECAEQLLEQLGGPLSDGFRMRLQDTIRIPLVFDTEPTI